MPLHRKQTRLSAAYYLGPRSHFITICCDLRQPHLANPETAELVRQLLLDSSRQNCFVLHAYCLMPDHLHLLTQGTQPLSDLRKFIRVFKSRSAFQFHRIASRRLWEKSYYDHILRDSDSPEGIACYIWWNPVRKRLCSSPQEFPYSGSETIRWTTRAVPDSQWCPPWRQNQPV